jgi:hypothetical protein
VTARAARILRVAALVGAISVALAQPALADNCGSQQDCERTAGYNAAIALAGGALALASGLFGNAIAGGTSTAVGGGTEGGTDAGGDATAPVKKRGCCLGWFTMIAGMPIAVLVLAMRVVGVI